MSSGWLLLAVAAMTVVAGCASPFAAPGASVGGGSPPVGGTSPPPEVTASIPVAIRVSPEAPVAGAPVNFLAEAPHAATFSWSFGDGTFSEARDPTHTYAAAGRFTVTLVAKAANGTRGSAERALVVGSQAVTPPTTNTTPPPPIVTPRSFLPAVIVADVAGSDPSLSVGPATVATAFSSPTPVATAIPAEAQRSTPTVQVARSADGTSFALLPAPTGGNAAFGGAVRQLADGATLLVQAHGPVASAARWTPGGAADGSMLVPGAPSVDAPMLASAGSVLYARLVDAAFNSWFARSDDAGKSWVPVQGAPLTSSCMPGGFVALSNTKLQTLVCSGDGLLRLASSSDGGATWTNRTVAGALEPIGPAALAARADGTVFVAYVAPEAAKGTELRLLKSRDGGATWETPFVLSKLGPAARPALALSPIGDRAVLAWYESDVAGAPAAAAQGAWTVMFTEIVDGSVAPGLPVAREPAHRGAACLEGAVCEDERLRLGGIAVDVGSDGRAWVAWTDALRVAGSKRVVVAHQ